MAKQENNLLHTLVIILAAGVILLGVIAALDTGSSESEKTLTVSGEATRTVAPDEAIISFSVITEHEDANTAREDNARRAEAVVESLRGYGDVETASFRVTPVYEPFRSEERDPRIQLYRVTNTVTVTMTELERVGEAIDAGTRAGANQVQNVRFGLTDETRDSIRTELLADAASNARMKADSLASGLDVRIVGVDSVSEGSVYFPGPYMARTESAAMDSAAPTTPIEPQELDVSASVSVSFAIH